jgi:hypothetical protein
VAEEEFLNRCANAIREDMFFGEVPSFGEILRVVGDFEKRLNKAK